MLLLRFRFFLCALLCKLVILTLYHFDHLKGIPIIVCCCCLQVSHAVGNPVQLYRFCDEVWYIQTPNN